MGDLGSIPGLGRSPGEGKGYPLQYSGLENSMDCSTPGFLVLHQPPEPAETHVRRVSDAIQPSHPLSCPSPHAFNLSQYQGVFQGVSIGVSASASVPPMNFHDWFPLGWTGLISRTRIYDLLSGACILPLKSCICRSGYWVCGLFGGTVWQLLSLNTYMMTGSEKSASVAEGIHSTVTWLW